MGPVPLGAGRPAPRRGIGAGRGLRLPGPARRAHARRRPSRTLQTPVEGICPGRSVRIGGYMLIRLRRLITRDGGQGTIPILVAVVGLGIVLYLVVRTEAVAGRIFKKADSIDKNAVTINNATDAVLKLKHTNA